MPLYHFSAQILGRSAGRSAVAAASYRAGSSITDRRTGITHNYRRRSGVAFTEITAPPGAPAWVFDRAALWNQVEENEKREDAQVAREFEVSLPVELGFTERLALVRGFIRDELVSLGMVADLACHAKGGNPHGHILVTMRRISEDLRGFGAKAREWNDRALLQGLRERWAVHVNQALAAAGVEGRVDHRTLAAQELAREPQRHQGPTARAMARRTANPNRTQQHPQEESTHERTAEQPRRTRRTADPEPGARPQYAPRRRR